MIAASLRDLFAFPGYVTKPFGGSVGQKGQFGWTEACTDGATDSRSSDIIPPLLGVTVMNFGCDEGVRCLVLLGMRHDRACVRPPNMVALLGTVLECDGIVARMTCIGAD